MTKWADYLISSVRYVETATTKHISHVKVHVDNDNTFGHPKERKRQDVINAIDLKSTFCTITKNTNGDWSKGALVEKMQIFGDWYIKTEKDNTTKDNLGALPEF